MATESDWYRKSEEPERASAADEMIAYAEKVASEYESEPQEERFEILMTSDAFPDPEDVYAIWDNVREKYYADDYGKILTIPQRKRQMRLGGSQESGCRQRSRGMAVCGTG